MMVRKCDKCGKEMSEESEEKEFILENEDTKAEIKLRHPDRDYCETCRKKMYAVAGLDVWTANKQARAKRTKDGTN